MVSSEESRETIIKLRNPWGHKEWKGSWNDTSSKWTAELKQRLGVEDKDDGIFWMEIRDFMSQFSQYCVCKVNQNYQYSAIQLDHIPTSQKLTQRVVMMRVFRNTHLHLSLSQKDKRYALFRNTL